jgi:hypothetical protein
MKITHLFFSLSLQSTAFLAAHAFPRDLSTRQNVAAPPGVIHLSITTLPKPANGTDTGPIEKRAPITTPVTPLAADLPLYNEYVGSFYIVNRTARRFFVQTSF